MMSLLLLIICHAKVKFFLVGVKQACCSFLEKQLDCSNCLGIKIFAEQHSCDVLWSAAETFSLRNFEDVLEQDEFKSLPAEELESLIKSNDIQVGKRLLFSFKCVVVFSKKV